MVAKYPLIYFPLFVHILAHVTFIIFLSLFLSNSKPSSSHSLSLAYIHTPFISFLPLLPKHSSIKPNIINTFYTIFSHQGFLDTFSPFPKHSFDKKWVKKRFWRYRYKTILHIINFELLFLKLFNLLNLVYFLF